MTFALTIIKGVVTALIFILAGLSFVPREGADRLVPLQKLLANEIARRKAS